MAAMPFVTLSGGSVPVVMCFAPLAESSKMLMSLIEIWCPFDTSLMGVSFGGFFDGYAYCWQEVYGV
jgi:hypothetical protein